MIDLGEFVDVAQSGSALELFAALDQLAQREVGAIIFSCSIFDVVKGKAERVYTNQPEAYPLSGLKDIIPNAWTRKVLDNSETFVANSIAEIAEVFPDHPLIAELGCGSVVNVPIKISGTFLGTMNLLEEAGYYTGERVGRVHDLRPAAMIAFLALERSQAS